MSPDATSQRHAATDRPERLSVLAVDDDPYLLSLTRRMLEREYGFRVETAENALDACRVLREEPVDCVVSDYRMPAVDGLDLLEAVRDADDAVPFVMFTNKGSERVEDRVNEAGAVYVQKDLELDQYTRLASAVRSAVEAGRDAGAGKGGKPPGTYGGT